MLIPESHLLECRLVLGLVDLLEDVLETTVVLLHDGVLGAQVKREVALDGILEAGLGEANNGFVGVVHSHEDTRSLELVGLHHCGSLAGILGFEGHNELTGLLSDEISSTVLITEGVSSNNDRGSPAWNHPRDVLDDDWLSEDGSVKLVSDSAVGGLVHGLEVELFDTRLIGSDGGPLDPHLAGLDGVGRVEGDTVIGGVAVLHAEIEVLDVEVEVGSDQLVLDGLPDDSGHFIAVELDDWIGNSDLLHVLFIFDTTKSLI